MSTINVILVEDNAVLREELQVFLTDCGWPVRAVSDGLELDLALRQASADIAILDVNGDLPVVFGHRRECVNNCD